MSEKQMPSLRPIGRRQFAKVCASSLAFAAVGCGRRGNQARAKHSTITVLNEDDERVLGPEYDDPPKFLVFLPLVTWNTKAELEGRLAQSWGHSPDYRTWTVHLRKDVRWHDGAPVTAHDVKFTLDLYMHPSVLLVLPGAYAVTVLDDRTYTITYHRQALPIRSPEDDDYTVYYPKHLLEKLDPKQFNSWEFWMHPVGNGPYRYVRHVPKTMMELEANPDYYRGKPKIERVVLKFGHPWRSGAVTDLLSGDVDVVPSINPTNLLKLRGDPRFRVYQGVYREKQMWFVALLWNQRYPPFRDPKVRRALTLAINRRELHQVVNLPEGLPIFDVPFSERQFRRGELPEPLPYDPEQAKRLLDEAGWRDQKGEGLRQRGGNPFRFTALASTFGGVDKAAVYIQAALHRVGVQMDVTLLEGEAAQRREYAGEFEAAILDQPLVVIGLFLGGAENQDVGEYESLVQGSPIGYGNPEVTTLLKEARDTLNPDEQDRIYRALWPILQADLPATFLYPEVNTTVVHRRVRGLSSPWRADPVWHMEDLWLEEEG